MKKHHKPSFRHTAIAAAVALGSSQLAAQEAGFQEEGQLPNFEQVFITGSHIKSDTEDASSPIQIFDRNMFEVSGASSIVDYVKNIPINTGSEFQLDSFTQNTSQGTASVNLRGLGLGSTLVLYNNKRTTLSAAFSNDGSSFVDINTLPSIALERVEVLKEGAAAVYGSDAVAGVMNFITRTDFEGIRFDAGYLSTTDGDQDEQELGFLWGGQVGGAHLTFALNYQHRNPLAAIDRDFTQTPNPQLGDSGLSAVGSPGALVYPGAALGLPPAIAPIVPLMDPTCAASGGIPDDRNPGLPVPVNTIGICNFDFKPYYQLITEEEHMQSMFTYRQDVTDSLSAYGDLLFSTSDIDQLETSPSLPIVDFLTVPSTNPAAVFWSSLPGFGALAGIDAVYAGRPLGNGAPADDNGKRNGETIRGVFGVEGDISDLWSYDTAIQYSRNEYELVNRDTRVSRFQQALAGNGGPSGGLTWNPLGPGLAPLGGGDNVQLVNWIMDDAEMLRISELLTIEFVATGEVMEIASGSISTAAGIQYRRESLEQDVSEGYSARDYASIIGADGFHEQREIWALFNEWDVPLADTLDMTAAIRYESYHGTDVGSSIDPKIALRWQATDEWVARGSISSSYRAPSIHQQAGGSVVNLEEIFDPGAFGGGTGGIKSFTPIIPSGNPDLDPESSIAFNAGFLFVPNETVSFSVDYWRFEVDDVIIRENAQTIAVNDAATRAPDCTGGDPAVTRSALCTITGVNVTYINSGEVSTDGIDLTTDFEWDLEDMGNLRSTFELTYVREYDITDESIPGSKEVDAAGKRNYTNFARSMPEFRANLAFMWVKNSHRASAVVHYTHNYENDQYVSNPAYVPGVNPPSDSYFLDFERVSSWTTLDLQYGYAMELQNDSTVDFTVGLINANDKKPPEVTAVLGYDTKLADPRGRMGYLRVSYRY